MAYPVRFIMTHTLSYLNPFLTFKFCVANVVKEHTKWNESYLMSTKRV